LQVDAHAAGFDLEGDYAEALGGREAVDDLLTFLRADPAMDLRAPADQEADFVEHLTEEGEDDDKGILISLGLSKRGGDSQKDDDDDDERNEEK
jgi:hypothetical protein